MTSFGTQARWVAALSITGQVISVAFIAVTSRMLDAAEFGYYIWAMTLPGMVVVFDLYLGLSLQMRLTELVAIGDTRGRDALIWGFVWGMFGVAGVFVGVLWLFTLTLTVLGGPSALGGIPEWVVWLGMVQVTSMSMSVPLVVAGVGYTAHHDAHRGGAWSLAADVLTKVTFLVGLATTSSLAFALVVSSLAAVGINFIPFVRFLRLYGISYLGPSWQLVRETVHHLLDYGQARTWAALRVVDGVYKNSELIIGAFVVGATRIGDFALLDRLSNALMLLANAAYVPLAPALTSARTLGNATRVTMLQRRAGQYSLIGLVLFSAMFLTMGERVATLWAGRPIEFAFPVVVLMCVRACTRVLSTLRWHLLMGHQLIRGLLWSTVAATVVYGVLYGSLLVRLGVLSTLIAQVTAHLVFLACGWMYARRDIAIPASVNQAAGTGAAVPWLSPVLKPYLKDIFNDYDEETYRILGDDCRKILAANAGMEHSAGHRLDIRVEGLARHALKTKLRFAGIQIPPDGLVVDLCCGTGFVARGLVEAGLASRVVGIDLSRLQLKHFQQAVKADGRLRGRIEILEADVGALPLADESATMVIGNSFLHHLVDVGLVLREAARVLQPGGAFVVLHEPGLTSTFFESFPLSLLKTIRNDNLTDLWHFDAAELERLLERSGFECARIIQTGIVGSVLLGAPSIVLNKFAPTWDTVHAVLQKSRNWLFGLEYAWSSRLAPSLLVTARKASRSSDGRTAGASR